MPITSSAKKALRVSERKHVFNLRRKNEKESVLRDIKKLLSEKKAKDAEKLLPDLYQAIDKMVKIKFLKKNAAARIKSRVTASVNAAKAKK